MKRGTESRVFLGKDTSIDEFTGINVLSTVLLGKKEGGFKDHNGLFIASNVTLGKGIARVITVVVYGTSPLSLPNAIEADVVSLKAFGGTEQETETIIQTATAQGKTEQRNLPDGYIERQFIYMMDDSYLLPNITPEADWHIEMDFQTTSVSTQVRNYFGSRYVDAPVGAGIRLAHTGSGYLVLYGFDTTNPYTGSGTSYKIQNNTRYKYVYNNNSASLSTGGTVVDSTTFTVNDTTTREVAINSYTSSDAWVTTTEGIYLYSFKAWNGQGELVMNLVPVVQTGTVPVVGFYDTVSGTFKTATAGTFAAGSEAVPTPDAPMDIICNNGVLKARHQSGLPLGYTLLESATGYANQSVIDTGVAGNNNNLRIVIKGYKDTNSGYTPLIANYVDESSNVTRIIAGSSAGQVIFNLNRKAASSDNLSNCSLSDLHTYELYKTAAGVTTIEVDGVVAGTSNNSQGTENATNLSLGNSRVLTAEPSTLASTYWYFYFCKIYDDGVLIRDYVPVKRNSDNVVGIYDLVNDTFDAGQYPSFAPFSAGNVVSDPVEIYTVGTQETVTDNIGNVAACERLLQVDTYTDTQEILSGTVTRNIGIKVLDGTESWTKSGAYAGAFYISNVAVAWGAKGESGGLCTHAKWFIGVQNYAPNTCGIDTSFNFWNGNFNASTTLTEFKQWLADQYAAGTPVIVVYPLATATTETVTGQNLRKEPLTVTGSLPNLLVNTTTGDAVPTPDYPLDIVCNNGVLKVSPNLYNSATRTDGYYIGADGTIAQGSGTFCYSALIPVKPNTAYVLSGIAGQTDNRRLHAYDSNGNWVSQISWATTSSGAAYNITGTTPATCAYVRISVPKLDTNVQVEKGSTATPYAPYSPNGIYTDGTVETIGLFGGNLYNSNTPTITAYVEQNTGILKQGTIHTAVAISIQPNTMYKLSGIKNATWWGTFTSSTIGTTATHCMAGNGTLTSGASDQYLICLLKATGTQYDYTDTLVIQTPQTATAEMLLSVGTYTDEQEVIAGNVTRKIGIKVLDGTESWAVASTNVLQADVLSPNSIQPAVGGYCTALSYTDSSTLSGMPENSFRLGSQVYPYRLYIKSSVYATDATTWTNYLKAQYAAGTPVIVVYPLATATTESVTGQPMATTQGDNIAEITQASMDGLALEVTYLAGATVTIQEVEDAQLSDDVDVTIH